MQHDEGLTSYPQHLYNILVLRQPIHATAIRCCHALLLRPCWFACLLPCYCRRCLFGRPCRSLLLRRLYCHQRLHHLLVLALRALGENRREFSFLAVFRLTLSAGRNLEEDDASWDELLVLWNRLQRIGVVALSEAPPVLGATRKQFPLVPHRC